MGREYLGLKNLKEVDFMPTAGLTVWLAALTAGLTRLVAFLPNLLGAIIILLIGWGVGKLIQNLLTRGLDALHFDRMTEHAGINDALKRANVARGPSAILGIVAYWFVFLVALNAAIDTLGIYTLSALMAAVILYLPRIFAALLVVIAGAWAASLLGRLTTASAATANISYAGTLGSIVQGTVLFFTFAIALGVLGLNFPFLMTAFAIVVGALGLGLAIAFGLGGQEYASDILAGRELRLVFQPGDRILTDDMDGTIQNLQPTIAVVSTARGNVAIQNSELMRKHATKPNMPGEEGRRAA